MKKILLLCSTLFVMQGCIHQNQYHWGEYENMVHASLIPGDNSDPTIQIGKLEETVSEATTKGKKVGPGIYGHLGYMYYKAGRTEDAFSAFEKEKELYPSSKTFIERLQNRIKPQDQVSH